MFLMQGKKMGRQVIWIGRNWGTIGADSEVCRYLRNRDGHRDYEGCESKTDVDACRVFAKTMFRDVRKAEPREPLSNFRTKCTGVGGGRNSVSRQRGKMKKRKGESKIPKRSKLDWQKWKGLV